MELSHVLIPKHLLGMRVMTIPHPLPAVFVETLGQLLLVSDVSPMLETIAIVLHAVVMTVAMAMVPRAVVLVAMAMALHMSRALTVNGMKQPPSFAWQSSQPIHSPKNPFGFPHS